MQFQHARKGPDTSVSGPFVVDRLYRLPKYRRAISPPWPILPNRGACLTGTVASGQWPVNAGKAGAEMIAATYEEGRKALMAARPRPAADPPAQSWEPVSNGQRGYHFFRDVETKLEYVGFNEAVPVRVATDI